MAEFEFKPDNRSFLTKLGEVARVTATATLCVLDNTNKTLVVTNKVLGKLFKTPISERWGSRFV